MISRELIRRYPFFARFSQEQVDTLSQAANLASVEPGYRFFHEGEELDHFYLVVEGLVGIIINVPDRDILQPLDRQLVGDFIPRSITVSTVRSGEIFGWSAIIPPYRSTAGAMAVESARAIDFDCQFLRGEFVEDCCFGHLLTLKAAQVVRGRLRDMRVASLAELAVS